MDAFKLCGLVPDNEHHRQKDWKMLQTFKFQALSPIPQPGSQVSWKSRSASQRCDAATRKCARGEPACPAIALASPFRARGKRRSPSIQTPCDAAFQANVILPEHQAFH